MKTKYFVSVLWFFVFVCGIFACNNQNKEQEQEPHKEIEREAITDFRLGLAKLHLDDQQIIFLSFPKELKSALWKDRIEEVLKMELTPKQEELLQELKERITPEIYDSIISHGFDNYSQEWTERAEIAFKDPDGPKLDDITLLLGKKNDANAVAQLAPGQPVCRCELGVNSWCDSPQTCQSIRPCTDRTCGFGWRYYCSGLCENPPEPSEQ